MPFLSKYGVARHIYIPMVKRAVVDHAVGADWTPAAGDVKISKDGGATANVTNLPTAIAMGNSAIWDFSITATEMEAAQVMVTIADSATKAVEDSGFIIETYGHASGQHAVDLDDGVRAGLTALPNAAAEAAGGLFTRGTGAGQVNQAANGMIDTNPVRLNNVSQSLLDLKDFADDGYDPATNKVQGVVLTDTVTTYTGNTPQTGDVFPLASTEIADIKAKTDNLPSDPADASVIAGLIAAVEAKVDIVDTVVDSILVDTAEIGAAGAGLTVLATQASVNTIDDFLDTEIAAIKVVTDNLARSAKLRVEITVGAASSTTSVITSAMDPAAAVTDQFKGRILIFAKDTTTANLRGQATDITASTALGVLTVTALTTAPVSGDLGVIV